MCVTLQSLDAYRPITAVEQVTIMRAIAGAGHLFATSQDHADALLSAAGDLAYAEMSERVDAITGWRIIQRARFYLGAVRWPAVVRSAVR